VENIRKYLKEGFFRGIGWSFGVTFGFVLISFLLVYLLKSLGGLPLVGNFIADIVISTENQLVKRTPVFENNNNN